jgi:hypothetical protein
VSSPKLFFFSYILFYLSYLCSTGPLENSFEDADVENADFTDAYLGDFDIKNLCKNPTLKGENPITKADTRLSVGCAYR